MNAHGPYGFAQLTGTRTHQCDATAVFTSAGTRAYAVLDGIGDDPTVTAWTRQTARYLARAGAVRADAQDALRVVHAVAASQRRNADTFEEPPSAVAVVAVVVPGRPLTVAWSGDVRAYLTNRTGCLVRLTTDHNMRQIALDEGRTPGPHDRNQVTSWIGDDDLNPQIGAITVPAYGRLLLVSDGAYEPIEDAGRDLADYLRGTPRAVAHRITSTAVAHAAGTALDSPDAKRADNATALVVDLPAHPDRPAAPAELPAWEETPAEAAAHDRAYFDRD